MVEIFRCARAEVYHNSGKKTLTQVKKETGCTHIINGYLFNSSFRPLGWTVIDGKIISRDALPGLGRQHRRGQKTRDGNGSGR